MSKYDILFEPLAIGPVTAPNRFIQVPHCNGLGHARPQAEAAHRGIKAEGGWGIVCTQEVEIHPSGEISPFNEGRLWDDRDIPAHRLTTDAIHKHGSLAAIELVYMGHHTANNYSRLPPLSVRNTPVDSLAPVTARAMTRSDIKDLREWHINAAKRSVEAGYDIVYVYAAHDMSVLMHFLQARMNNRHDEYGGSIKNRIRLVREIIEAVKDAVGHRAAVAFRCAVDELEGSQGIEANGDGAEIVAELAELPDLWDVNVSDWSNDSATARFEPQEGYQLPYTQFVKSLTSKPVVGVGRFTSPDRMASLVTKGVLDFIGAARPSIADPFLPAKIKSGQLETIRECIGCNICVSSDNVIQPIRCTQNPTAGEEWRRQWHPEKHKVATNSERILIVGAGPAGLEAALQLTQQGHQVVVTDRKKEAGGRAMLESQLPGLSSYKRVADYRVGLLSTSSRAEILLDNDLSDKDILELDFQHICIATGASWHRDGFGRNNRQGINMQTANIPILTPDDLMAENSPNKVPSSLHDKHVLVYDDDHYYMGGVIAELLSNANCSVTLATPASLVSAWTEHTLEQHKIQSTLIHKGVDILANRKLVSVQSDAAQLDCIFEGKTIEKTIDAVVLVTSRSPDNEIFFQLESQLQSRQQTGSQSMIKTISYIGDCHAPSTIAAAVYQGHRYARNFTGDKTSSFYADVDADIYAREFVDMSADRI